MSVEKTTYANTNDYVQKHFKNIISYYSTLHHIDNPKHISVSDFIKNDEKPMFNNSDKDVIIYHDGIFSAQLIHEVLIIAAIENVNIHFAIIDASWSVNKTLIEFVLNYNLYKSYVYKMPDYRQRGHKFCEVFGLDKFTYIPPQIYDVLNRTTMHVFNVNGCIIV